MNAVKHLAGLVAFVFLVSCGGGGGSSSTSTSNSVNEKMIGNFNFVYTLVSQYNDRVTITSTTSSSTFEGTPFYTGYNADSTSNLAVGAYWPSTGKYMILMATSVSSIRLGYSFVIESDNRLTGSFFLVANGVLSAPYALDSSASKKFASGAWARTMDQKAGDENIALKIQEVGALNSLHQQDVKLTAKIGELQAVLGSLGK